MRTAAAVTVGARGSRSRSWSQPSVTSFPVDIPPAAEPLYSLPPTRFTAERNSLARALADRRDPAAAAVRKLPRPVGLAWVLNRLAQERPHEMAALVAAGDRLSSGQRRALSGAGADELRAAEDDLRGRARALRSEAERILAAEKRPAQPAVLARLELLLRVAAPVAGPGRDALRRGVLVREPEIATGELAGFAVLAGGRGMTAPRGERRTPSQRPMARAASRKRIRAADDREAREREARERRERERLVAAARRDAEVARARAEREERAASDASDRARSAGKVAAAARAEADRLAARLQEIERGE